jgi:phosphoribosylformylglycinamidine cyclo-ligase
VLHAAAHVTGGGIVENLPRALPEGLGATLTRGSWPEHPIFRVIQEAAGASDADMFATFNMGIGMVLVVAPDRASEVVRRNAHEAFPMGEVTARSGVRVV